LKKRLRRAIKLEFLRILIMTLIQKNHFGMVSRYKGFLRLEKANGGTERKSTFPMKNSQISVLYF
jgi:hypothetical protein